MKDELSLSPWSSRDSKIDVVYYTDPYDIWGLEVEKIIDKLTKEHPRRLKVIYKAFPIVKDVDEILPDDPAERIEAIQGLAAFFREVSENTGIDLDPSFLYDDPPNSTWPACLAFKAAMRQGRRKGETFLRRLRRACLQENKNITKSDVLESIARECGLDVEEFLEDFYSEETEREVHEDIEMGVKEGITGMPALVFGNQAGLRVTVLGPRSLQEYRKVIRWLSTNQGEDIHRSFYA